MRRVKVFKYEHEKDPQLPHRTRQVKKFDCEGTFLQFGVDSDSEDNGMGGWTLGSYTVAIVERDDGTVAMVYPDLIQFIVDPKDRPHGWWKKDR
jgi:hypothetical protein